MNLINAFVKASPILSIIFFLLLVGMIIFAVAASDQAIHLISGKTDAEYITLNGQLSDANKKIADLTSQVDDLTTQLTERKLQTVSLIGEVSDLTISLTTYRSLVCQSRQWDIIVTESNYSGDMSGNNEYEGQTLSIYGFEKDLFFASTNLALNVRRDCIIVNPGWKGLD
jgi:hypothetical protein